MKIRPAAAELFYAYRQIDRQTDRRTDGQTGNDKAKSLFRNFAKAFKHCPMLQYNSTITLLHYNATLQFYITILQ
jgi:hypothetical protein